ncbi:hypothetical protein B0O99DRAFT_641709 [Bisporella sp. PMI_857]|nr:hypothetical protein B0O99DRAFT_641709 [Bisporella sp. PMI_857]
MTHRKTEDYRLKERGPQSPPPSYAGYPPNSPQPYYVEPYQNNEIYHQSQSYQHSAHEMPTKSYQHVQDHKVYHNGEGGYPAHIPQPQVVYVQAPNDKKHSGGAFCAGCLAGCAGCACCWCTVM